MVDDDVKVQVQAELTDFIVNNYLFGDVLRTPGNDDSLVEDGVIDSTGILELIEFLESQFGITVTEEETIPQNLGTIAHLVEFVTAKQDAGATVR
jgi:acyl carrier protein